VNRKGIRQQSEHPNEDSQGGGLHPYEARTMYSRHSDKKFSDLLKQLWTYVSPRSKAGMNSERIIAKRGYEINSRDI
jgi:hypothetical protein